MPKHGRTGRKKLGGRKEICPTFSDCARVVKKNFPEKLSKIVVDGGRTDYEKFLLDSIFPTKLTESVPFIFIISQYCPTVKRILPDWLCLPNKLGGWGCRPPRPPPPHAHVPKVVGSIPTVARHIFQACPVWIYTQSNITNNHTYFIYVRNR